MLEELLADYKGTVLLVSHDRVFLDRVVTSCLVFDGQGSIEESVGGYSDWYERGGRLQSAFVDNDTSVKATPQTDKNTVPAAKQAKKLSYKVQRELDQLPELIETLEAALDKLQAEVGAPDFYVQEHTLVSEKLAELSAKEEALEQAMERWMEIEEMLA